ncbi:hypothetical protein [Natronospora cellulosivora (SeqCode)]
MKKYFIIILMSCIVFLASVGVEAVYFADEITDEMIEEWIEEVRPYRSESWLDTDVTGHSFTDFDELDFTMRSVTLRTNARLAMQEIHEQQRKYIEPSIESVREYIEELPGLAVNQVLIVEERSDRNPDDMHLVFFVIEYNENNQLIQENVIQPIEWNSGSAEYFFDIEMHYSEKVYVFSYDDFPSRQEFEEGNYEIIVKHISNAGEIDIKIPWDEVR